MSSPLLVVTLVLRHRNEGATLDQLGHLIADYLGPDRNLSLSAACKFGSTTLLDWIWGHSPTSTTNRSPQWLLTNYLRSDLHYYQYQFQQSVLVAVKKGDLRVLEWLMEHFSGCEVPVAAVETAAELGRLDMLQFLVKHDTGRRDAEVPSRKKRKLDTGPLNGELGGGNWVHWGGYSLVQAASKKHFDIIRFLHDNTPSDVYTNTLDEAIGLALECGEMDLVETLLPPGKSVIDYGQGSLNPAVLELTFDAGLLDGKFFAATALNRLVASSSVDLMKKIWEKHAQLTSTGDWMKEWMEAMATACQMGNLAILQWMVEHNSGRAAITHSKQLYDGRVSLLLYCATAAGHLDAMQYLHEQGAGVDYGNALLCAIRRDRMDAVKWLLAHFPG